MYIQNYIQIKAIFATSEWPPKYLDVIISFELDQQDVAN